MGTVAFPGSEVPNKHVGREKIPGIPFKNNPAPDKHVNKQSAYTPPKKRTHGVENRRRSKIGVEKRRWFSTRVYSA